MTEPSFLRGEQVRLRPATPGHKRMIFDALARSDLTDRLLGHPGQASTRFLTWEAFCQDSKAHYFDDSRPRAGRCYVIEVDGRPVGQVNYNDIDPEKERTELDIWMLSEAQCGHGYGPDALRVFCHYLLRSFGVREVFIKPSASNSRAIRAYEKAGFMRSPLPPEQAEAEYGPKEDVDTVYMTKSLHDEEPPTARPT